MFPRTPSQLQTMSDKSYDELIEKYPVLEGVANKKIWDYLDKCNDYTVGLMEDVWKDNVKANLEKLYPKYKSIAHAFFDFGKDKSFIGVGAGPSLNNNIHHLDEVYRFNAQFRLEQQPFIISACNHQFKPLLKRGIFPHLVFLSDGGSHIYDQLCKDIPKFGQSTILIASIYSDHKTLMDWTKQGRTLCFTVPGQDLYQQMFKDIIGEDPAAFTVGSGGNVLNTMFTSSLKVLHSNYFMALGNDLSYPYDPKLEKRRSMFYADGDYSTNIKRKGADEAKRNFTWIGFRMRDNPFQQGRKIIDLEKVNTSRQMFIYKTWLETHVAMWEADPNIWFVYYNCSESGIAGVLAKDYDPELLDDPDNWYMLDDVVPKRWRTRSLLQAVNEFLEASLICREKNASPLNVIISPHEMAGANNIVQSIR